MPRRGDYSKCKIYKVISLSNPEYVYFGHTCIALSQRFSIHKSKNNKCKSKIVIEKGDAVIMLVENFPCQDDDEASAREKYYIINNVCVNKNIPARTQDEIKQRQNEYRQANLDSIKEKMKEYQTNNKDKMKKYIKKYHEKYYSDYHKCECGSEYTLNNICHHKQTKKHIKFLEQKQINNAIDVLNEVVENLIIEKEAVITDEERSLINELFPIMEELNDDTISVLLPDLKK